ncbi:TetR/AcrR family transcriptional regulator [Actomonas aquatica]|uniref:TetR/AcrR family transcriptional regulator n=1 Tax=Actomonas aquatica TaxID=2866162 RepID=A0ABZ1C4V2_9BACT|nr:TetR/AcrR family transcriptional regulator [Opitutus sp. WL0086]WRQ86756.1 TetR/AcrR family transcriptional regulator [Opitutus sp. WL0086]
MRPRDEAKIEVIHAETVRLVAEHGFDGLSMHKLAKAAGVSAATLYIYFKDREDLIEQVGVASMRRLVEASLAGFEPEMSLAEGLRVQWHNRSRYILAHPHELQFLEALRFSRFESAVMDRQQSAFREVMRPFLHGAVARGELQPMEPEVFWSLAFAPLYQLLKFHLNKAGFMRRPFRFTETHFEQSLAAVLRALTPPAVSNDGAGKGDF